MLRISRKLIALLMVLWLPLFSGSALAASVGMQSVGGDCSAAVSQPADHHSNHAGAHQQHAEHASHSGSMQDHQHDTSCKNCGVCHIACCAYLATVDAGMDVLLPSDRSYASSPTQFQSITFAPLDPPPLARV